MSRQPGQGGATCPECGAQVSGRQSHCGNCGANLGHGRRASQAGEQPRGQQQGQRGQQQGQRGQQQQPPPNQPPRQQPAQQQQQGDDGWSTLVIVLVLCGGGLCLIPALFVIASVILTSSLFFALDNVDDPAPVTSFDYKYSGNGTVEIEVGSGDTFNASQVRFEGEGLADPGANWHEKDPDVGRADSVDMGDSVVVDVTGSDYELELIWESADGDRQVVIDTSTGPDRQFPP